MRTALCNFVVFRNNIQGLGLGIQYSGKNTPEINESIHPI
jgi:hypothetical protein